MKLLSRKTYLLISLAIILYIFSGLVQSAWAAEGQVSSPKKDWQINERPSFEVKYAERGLAKRIFDWATFSFRSESSISAKLITQVSGETKDLKEGEDFVVDYSSGAAKIELSPMLEMKPGKQTLVAKITSEGEEYDITQDFTWGVLALNADKSIYAPKEVASLQFGVLDENGNMVCNAKLFLEIISPDGKSTLLSTENNRIKINEDVCSAKAYTLKPDYAAKYQLQEAGEYVLTLKAESEHGTYSISDKIEVHDSAAFEVKRTSATRIYPLNGYPVALDITANENFDGLIQESVPASFEIKKFEEDGYKAFDSQETQGSAKIITWKVSAKKGDKLKLGYQYDAPDISPEFYLLGPLKFVASQNLLQKIVSLSSADSKIVFEEVRQWQIASDAVGISLIGTPQTGVANNGANVTLTWSTRPSTGDVTVVIVGSPAATPAGCSVSTSDYQTAKTFTGSGNTQPTMAVFYKVQGATTDTNVVVKADGAATTDSTAIGYVLRGVDNANVLDQTATTAGVTTGTNPDPAAIVVQTNKAWVIASAVSVQAGDASPGTISGYTNHYQTTGSDTYNHTIAAATKEVATPATENPGKWSTWATGNWYAITTAIKAEPGITISGTSNVGVGTTVRAAVGGSLIAETGTVDGGGNWSISGVTKPSADAIITAFVTDGDGDIPDANESTAIAKYSGSGAMTGMVLNTNVLSVGGVGNQSISIADLVTANYDSDQDEDIMYDAETGSLLAQAAVNTYAAEKIDILASDTFTVGNSESLTTYDLTLTGTLVSGTLGTFNVSHNWTNNGAFTQSTSTVDMNGTTAQTINGSTSTTFNNLTLSNTSAAVSTGGNESVNGNLTINASAILSPGASYTIGGSGTLTGSGTAQVTRTAATPDFLSQYTITNKALTNLTVAYVSDSAQTVSAVDYGNLLSSGAGGRTLASTGTIGISGTFTVGSNTYTTTGSTVNYNGSAAQTAGVITYNNLTITNSSGNAAGVTFPDSTTVSGTFTDTTADSRLVFTATKTYAFANISIAGTTGHEVILDSANTPHGAGSQWIFNVSQTNPAATYVKVYDSNAAGSHDSIDATTGGVNGGNNTNWDFPVVGITISGTTDEASGTVWVAVNNTYQSGKSGSITGTGPYTWSIAGVAQPSAGDVITVWINSAADADESTGIGVYSSGNMTDMVLDRNVLSVGGAGSQSVTVASLCNASYNFDNGDNEDVMHTCSGTTFTVDGGNGGAGSYSAEKLDVLAADTLTLNGHTLNTDHLQVDGTLTSSGTDAINIAGSGTGSSRPFVVNGVFNEGSNSTVKYTGISASDMQAETYNNLQLAPKDNALAGYWKFDEGSGPTTADASGNGNTETWHGTGSHWTDGKYNGGGDFNGTDDYLDADNSSSLNITGNKITVSAWVNFSNTSNHQIFVAKTYSATQHDPPYFSYAIVGLYVNSTTITPRFSVTTASDHYLPANVNITAGTWYLITGTYDGQNMNIYINGENKGTLPVTGNLTGYNTPLRIGKNGGFGESFKGKMDDARVYSRALSTQEISDLYNNTSPAYNLGAKSGASSDTMDSYAGPRDNYLALNNTYKKGGQSFAGNGLPVTSVQFFLAKNNSPSGNAYARIYAMSGTWNTGDNVPTGVPLAASFPLDVTTLTGSYAMKTFTFAAPFPTVAGTKYVVTLEYDSGTSSNYVMMGTDESTPTHVGNTSKYDVSWSSSGTGIDLVFSVQRSAGMGSTIDSYSASNNDNGNIYVEASQPGIGQSMTGNGQALGSAEFFFFKTGSPTGNVVAKLYAESHATAFGTDSLPSGTALATSAAIDASNLPPTPDAYIPVLFTFPAPYFTLSNGTKYVLTIEFSGGDGSNYLSLGSRTTAPDHAGNLTYSGGGTWSATNAYDLCFYALAPETSWDATNVAGNFTVGDGLIGINASYNTADKVLNVDGLFSIQSGATYVAAPTANLTAGGSWANSGTFTANGGNVVFDAGATGKTINTGGTSYPFFNVEFSSASGGWTVGTNNVLVSSNLTFTSVSSWANDKSISIRVGGTLSVAANQDIRMWNSSAAGAYSVDASGSLYSMNHNSAPGSVYIWGDYHVTGTDYWSYATDFDATDISGAPRAARVWIDPSSNVTVDSTKTLNAIGQASAGMTIVDRQGSTGGYGMTAASTSTINFKYTDFEHLDGPNGLNIQTANVTDLDNCKFNNLEDSGASDRFITVDAAVITSNPTWDYVQFDNSSGGANYNVYRTGTAGANYWSFANYSGLFDEATYEYENGGGDMIRWVSTVDSPGSQESIQGTVNFEGSATFN